MNNIAFSICIPNYNYGNYIGQTIQSVLNQTYHFFEIIIVDNASTDNSIEVIESFKDDRIHLYRNVYNVGFSPNLDRAASKANNPFIIMLSSDDLMHPTALEVYKNVILSLETDSERTLLVSECDVIDGEGKRFDVYKRNYYLNGLDGSKKTITNNVEINIFSGLDVFRQVYPNNMVPGHFCTTLYSKQMYDSVEGYSSMNYIGPDAHFVNKLLLENVSVVFVDEPLFAYRIHGKGQVDQAGKNKNLLVPMDYYLFTILYPDQKLTNANISRESIKNNMIEEGCIKAAFHQLRNGDSFQSLRLFFFGLAAFPIIMLRNIKAYLIFPLIVLGPIGTHLARLIYRNKKIFQKRTTLNANITK